MVLFVREVSTLNYFYGTALVVYRSGNGFNLMIVIRTNPRDDFDAMYNAEQFLFASQTGRFERLEGTDVPRSSFYGIVSEDGKSIETLLWKQGTEIELLGAVIGEDVSLWNNDFQATMADYCASEVSVGN